MRAFPDQSKGMWLLFAGLGIRGPSCLMGKV